MNNLGFSFEVKEQFCCDAEIGRKDNYSRWPINEIGDTVPCDMIWLKGAGSVSQTARHREAREWDSLMSGWGIALWFTDLFIGAGLIGCGLYLRARYSGGWFIVALGVGMEIAFVIFGPDLF